MKKYILALMAVVALFATSCSEQGAGDEIETPDTPEIEVTELSMGFFAYDGIDEASGRHRVNFYGSTNPRYGEEKDYIDVTIFMYLLYDPGDYVTPGDYVPYADDGSNMKVNLVYKPGKRCLIDGEPNMQGSGWWTLEDKEIVAFNPSIEGTHTITFDAKTKATTISGSMVDSETDETFNFTYSTDEPLLRFDDY